MTGSLDLITVTVMVRVMKFCWNAVAENYRGVVALGNIERVSNNEWQQSVSKRHKLLALMDDQTDLVTNNAGQGLCTRHFLVARRWSTGFQVDSLHINMPSVQDWKRHEKGDAEP